MRAACTAALTVAISTAGVGAASGQTTVECTREQRCLPSQALVGIFGELLANPQDQEGIVDRYEHGIRTNVRDETEQFALAEFYFLNFQPRLAKRIFVRFMDRPDCFGRFAWQRVMQMEFRAFDLPERVEEMLPEFERRYGYASCDLSGPSNQAFNFATSYVAAGENDRAAELIARYAREAPFDSPYSAHGLPVRFKDAFVAAGRTEELRALLTRSRDGLAAALERERVQPPATPEGLPIWLMAMNRVPPGATWQSARLYGYTQLIGQIDQALASLP